MSWFTELIARAWAQRPLPELPPLHVNEDGWLEGDGVGIIKAHSSWHYPRLATPTGAPAAIVCHCSDTLAGSAEGMAHRRNRPRKPDQRPASWHISVEADGSVLQMISLEAGAWHAIGTLPKVGAYNRVSVGIELIGKPAGPWPQAQVDGARRVWRAVCQSYGIPRARAMIPHSSFESRRSDPGKEWMSKHAGAVLDYVYRA